jgi:hypothetical protein
MTGAPPGKADPGPFDNPVVKTAIDLLKTVVIGASLGAACAFVVFCLAALFGDVAGVTGERALSPAGLPKFVEPSLAAAKAGAINFTISRYLLLSKSKLRDLLPVLGGIVVVGAFLGLTMAGMLGWRSPLLAAEWCGIAFFWLASLGVAQRDDNKGRDYFSYRYRR